MWESVPKNNCTFLEMKMVNIKVSHRNETNRKSPENIYVLLGCVLSKFPFLIYFKID